MVLCVRMVRCVKLIECYDDVVVNKVYFFWSNWNFYDLLVYECGCVVGRISIDLVIGVFGRWSWSFLLWGIGGVFWYR